MYQIFCRPTPHWGAYSAPRPGPLAVFRGPISKEGMEEKGEKGEGKGEDGRWDGRGEERRGEEEKGELEKVRGIFRPLL